MGILFPHFYALTSGLTAVTPLQAFGCTVGQHVVCLYRHYDPGSIYAAGNSSNEITNLVLDCVSTGKFFLSVSAGCSDVSQKDLRDPSSMYLYTERSLVSVSLRVRMDAIMKQGACSHARALVLALQKLSDQQASIILQRGMQTANLLLQPLLSLVFACAGMLSVDGRCKTFDARANGYARAEGVGAVAIGAAEGWGVLTQT